MRWSLALIVVTNGCLPLALRGIAVSDEQCVPSVHVDPAAMPAERLSAYHLFRDARRQIPNDRVEPYGLNTPHFADYATLHRFLWLPRGHAINYTGDGVLEYPTGAVIVITIGYLHDLRDPSAGEQLIETRLWIRRQADWLGAQYVWNGAATEARFTPSGGRATTAWIDHQGTCQSHTFLMPNSNQCKQCHVINGQLVPLGPVHARNINRDYPYTGGVENQLVRWTRLGYLSGAPARPTDVPRLLIHGEKGWVGVPYLWNDAATDARRAVVGGKTTVAWYNADNAPRTLLYLTPDMNQCKRCHENEKRVRPIGVTARNLNRKLNVDGSPENQLDYWRRHGYLNKLPRNPTLIPRLVVWNDPESGSVEQRARAWLDVNCAHCHNPHGPAIVSGLDLSLKQGNRVRYGVYKPPVAAGRGSGGHRFGISPGNPQDSFLLSRITSTSPGTMMPPLGRSSVDVDGVALVRQWIREMTPDKTLADAALNPMQAYREAAAGGDASRGETIFRTIGNCVACHRVGEAQGGRVGPNLTEVGKRAVRDYLLQSVIEPSASIVKGYETVVLALASGNVLSGTVLSEDAYEIVVATPTGESVPISKEDIEERVQSPKSTMPSVANVLTVDQVRDVVAYLASLKGT